MVSHGKEIKIFSANSNPRLAEAIVDELNRKVPGYTVTETLTGQKRDVRLRLGESDIRTFSDGEISVNINETVRGADVFLVQSTCYPVNEHIMELLIMVDALKRASAGRITAVIPYYGYARQDRKAKARDPISAKLIADLITSAGADRVLTMDLHAPQIQGFFDIPVDHLLGMPILSPYYAKKFQDNLSDVIIVAPDFGSVTRARIFAQRLDVPIAIIDKRRPRANVAEIMNIIGDVEGKKVIMVDDMIDTAGTFCLGAEALLSRGASEIYACCTHAVLSGPAIQRIKECPIKELVVLDTIQLPPEKKLDKIKVLSVAEVFAEAIKRIYADISVSTLFV